MTYIGDYALEDEVHLMFNTVDTGGAPVTFSGSPTLAVYKHPSTTEITAGVYLDVDYDSVTGLNLATIDTADVGYEVAKDYTIVITAGTADSVSQVGRVLGSFSIENRRGQIFAIFKTQMSDIGTTFVPTLANAVRKLTNKWDVSSTTLTVYMEDGTTPAYTETLSTASGADSVTGATPD